MKVLFDWGSANVIDSRIQCICQYIEQLHKNYKELIVVFIAGMHLNTPLGTVAVPQ